MINRDRNNIPEQSIPPSRLKQRTRLFFLPFLKLLAVFVAGYNFLSMVAGAALGQVSIKDGPLNLFLPLILLFFALIFWVRPRIMLFQFSWMKWRLIIGYHLVVFILVMMLTLFVQDYLDKVTSGLTPLENIDGITAKRQTKFYTLERYYYDKSRAGTFMSLDVDKDERKKWYRTSKERTELKFVVVIPILAQAADTSKNHCSAWLGMVYREKYNYEISDVNSVECIALKEKSLSNLEQADLDQFVYLDRVTGKLAGYEYREAMANSPVKCAEDTPVFIAVNELFDKRTEGPMRWILVMFPLSCGIIFLMAFIPKVDPEKVSAFEAELESRQRKKKDKHLRHDDGAYNKRE
jgi:rhomboid protease GluP